MSDIIKLGFPPILGGVGSLFISYGIYELFNSLLEVNTLREIAFKSVDELTPEVINQTMTINDYVLYTDINVGLGSIAMGTAILVLTYELIKESYK
ncbi:MAG: hypothetical protein KAS11_04805 [Candidatus Aenigmarchaeota archaeon]|nr:hypothetical protein [Candidatus Aenigmarchaeota archaeon]